MTYPLKFREKVFAVKDKYNLTFEQTSERFDVPMRTLFRWQKRLHPCLNRNKPATKIDMQALAKDVEDHPDDYQHERAERFHVSQSGIAVALKRLRVTRKKKTLNHPKADPERRHAFGQQIRAYETLGYACVYVDESGFAHSMPRAYGYSRSGQRCHGLCDWGAKGRTNVIGALLGQRLLNVSLFDRTVNADVFYAWLTQQLLPALPPDSVIVLDNASFHRRTDILQAADEAGHLIEFLPTYSPDLNPIEHKWAEKKAHRRRYRCDVETLFSEYTEYANL